MAFMQYLCNGKWESKTLRGHAYCEMHDGAHKNKTLWAKAMDYFSNKEWGKSTRTLDRLLTNHPHYYATCIHNFTVSIYKYIEQTLTPYKLNNPKVSKEFAEAFREVSEIQRRYSKMYFYYGIGMYNTSKLRSDYNKYKLIISYHKRWIHIVKKSKPHTDVQTNIFRQYR
eukprot:31773_1